MRLKKLVSRMPGSVETYKLVRNLRFAARARLGTPGNIRSLGMGREEAGGYVREIFGKVDATVRRVGGWAGKRVLEIGPGDSLGVGLLVLAGGAARYRAIDRFPVSFDRAAERRIFLDLIDSFSGLQQARVADTVEITPTGYRILDDRFSYSNSISIEHAPHHFSGEKFDVVFSNAVLEHVADVRSSFEAMRELLAPEGVMLHDVDLRSHQRFEQHALHFLEYSPFLWKIMTSHTGEPNRVRFPTYIQILEDLGFLDIRVDVRERFDAELVRKVKPRLAEAFRSLEGEDLAVAAFRLEATAPPASPERSPRVVAE
jgi:SAM-dependent methyltransferase